jgi:hypothetical protein
MVRKFSAPPFDLADPHFTEEVRLAAYLLWEQEGRPDGQDQRFWYRALEIRIEEWMRTQDTDEKLPGVEAAGRRGH